jgi:phosphatidylserine synthase
MKNTLEERVECLEAEMNVLTYKIQQTLVSVQEQLDETPNRRSRWRRHAWVIALLNMLLAIVLFVNIRFYTLEDLPVNIHPSWVPWLQAFWLILALLWLLLQLYPLVLLFEAEEQPLRDIAWRNAGRIFARNPTLLAVVTAFVLVVTIISALFPTVWLVMMFVMLLSVLFWGVRSVIQNIQ